MEGSMNAVSSFALLAVLAGSSDPVLVQFTSDRCPHCQAMQPIVAQLAQQGVPVQVINVAQQTDAARQFSVSGVPTFVAISSGRELGRIEGATSYQKLAALVQGSVVSSQASELGHREPASPGSPSPAPSALSAEHGVRAATVRLKVEDATGYGFGTGTIIDVHDSEALAVTCGHLFRESKGKGRITVDLFVGGASQTVSGQLIAYNLDRDIALISLCLGSPVRPVTIAPPGHAVRPGDRVFTIGCDKGTDPSVRVTHITAVNKYQGKPNYTAAGQPIDGRSGGGLFTSEGYLIGICNAADPADDEGLYAGLASIHWQLDQIGQSEVYQRAARLAATSTTRDTSVALASVQTPALPTDPPPALPAQMPAGPIAAAEVGRDKAASAAGSPTPSAVSGDDTEIVFIVRSKRDPEQRSEVFVVDQASPDLLARIAHAARTSGEQRAALARAQQPAVRTAGTDPRVAPSVVRGQSGEY
jgi:thiol-disulfide isomerase/thioredoxin